MEEAKNEKKKMKCYKRLRLCGVQFLNYLLKRFTHLYRTLYGDGVLVDSFGPSLWPPEIDKNIWSSLFL